VSVETIAPAEELRHAVRRPHPVWAELLKIFTTSTWWIIGAANLIGLAVTLLIITVLVQSDIDEARKPIDLEGLSGTLAQAVADSHNLPQVLRNSAANLYTGGQYVGLLAVMILGVLMVTSEYHHQTATTTFLATPRRARVVIAKLTAASLIAGLFWLVSTLVDLVVGHLFFVGEGTTDSLTAWPVDRAILINLLAYVLWAILGVGLGMMIRNQSAAVVVAAALYLAGSPLGRILFYVLFIVFKADWAIQAQIALPSVASEVMITADDTGSISSDLTNTLLTQPPWWVGALILTGWGAIFAVAGNAATQARDIT
jgi:ABC-type transport system involved in multi-copper enzyme maturation permease subunit